MFVTPEFVTVSSDHKPPTRTAVKYHNSTHLLVNIRHFLYSLAVRTEGHQEETNVCDAPDRPHGSSGFPYKTDLQCPGKPGARRGVAARWPTRVRRKSLQNSMRGRLSFSRGAERFSWGFCPVHLRRPQPARRGLLQRYSESFRRIRTRSFTTYLYESHQR